MLFSQRLRLDEQRTRAAAERTDAAENVHGRHPTAGESALRELAVRACGSCVGLYCAGIADERARWSSGTPSVRLSPQPFY